MKKTILVLFAAALSFAVSAQTFGVKAGLNMSSMSYGSDLDAFSDEANSLIGFSLGATAAFELSDVIDLDASLAFIQKGNSVSFGDDDLKTRFNFIELTPMAAYNITEELAIMAGPYIGFAISGTQDALEIDLFSGESTVTSEDIDFDASEINTLDYGLNIGVSYILNEMIDIRAGYSLGLADMNAADQGDLDLSQKNNGIYFTVGYLFNR